MAFSTINLSIPKKNAGLAGSKRNYWQRWRQPKHIVCSKIRQFAEVIGESAPSYWVVYNPVRELPDSLLTLAHQGGKAYPRTMNTSMSETAGCNGINGMVLPHVW